MYMHLLENPLRNSVPPSHPPSFEYLGRHRSPRHNDLCRFGALVVEPRSSCPSSVIKQVDGRTALVRHVGTCDDHVMQIADLVPFADGVTVRLAAAFSGVA
jgi:hypothetical protein